MTTPVSSFMHRFVKPVGMDDSIEQVEAMLKRNRISSAPVQDSDGTLVGIITSTDLIRFRDTEKDAKDMKAWEICSYLPLRVQPDTPATDVARMMVDNNLHHILVMQDDEMQGIVSALDFVRAFTDGDID